MQIKNGQNRIVFVFPKFGIVVKFPLIAIGELKWSIKTIEWKFIKEEQVFRKLLLGSFLKGLLNNWREFYFYLKTRHPFLQPVYFSLIGFVNIQKLGKHCTIPKIDFQLQLQKITDEAINEDGHHFFNPKNFCFDGKRLKIFDYGNPKTQKVILECGMKIFNEFDPNWKKESIQGA